jgi:organic radical activating enzyme
MTSWQKRLQRLLSPRVEPLPVGLYARKSPPDASLPHRLHLRLEPDGRGVLLINAATILHLNPTAAEYAYHLVQGTPPEQAASEIADRYRVTQEQAAQDFQDFVEQVETLYLDPDRAPVSSEDLERRAPFSGQISAPYRLDCALTYRASPQEQLEDDAQSSAGNELTTEEWQAILDKAWDAGIPHTVFCGGEPTLRPDLPALLEHAERLGMVTGLLTDGRYLTESAYLDDLFQAGLDHVMVLLEPQGAKNLDALTRINYWAETLEAPLHIAAHLTITPENAPKSTAWLERLATTGVHAISLTASRPELATELLAARDRAAALGLPLNWGLPVPYAQLNPAALELEAGDSFADRAARTWLRVEPDGVVRSEWGDERVLGNMLRDPWKSLWGAMPPQRHKS